MIACHHFDITTDSVAMSVDFFPDNGLSQHMLTLFRDDDAADEADDGIGGWRALSEHSDDTVWGDPVQEIRIVGRHVVIEAGEHRYQRICHDVSLVQWQGMLQLLVASRADASPLVVVDGGAAVSAFNAINDEVQARQRRWPLLREELNPRVRVLLTLGRESFDAGEWADYGAIGFSRDDQPQLQELALQMTMLDDWPVPEAFASAHAWRVLALLADPASLPVLLLLYRYACDCDWIMEEIPRLMPHFGAMAIAPLTALMQRRDQYSFNRTSAAEALENLGKTCPPLRAECVAVLACTLDNYRQESAQFNAHIIGSLITLQAIEQAPLMAQVFHDNMADWSINGDWEAVQIDLGLLDRRLTAQPNFLHWGKSSEQIALMQAWAKARRDDERAAFAGKCAQKSKKKQRKQQAKARKKARPKK